MSASSHLGSAGPRRITISRKKSSTTTAPTVDSTVASRYSRGHSTDDHDKNVFRFVYSEAVDKAMRKKYRRSALPELLTQASTMSMKRIPPTGNKMVEILKLPQLYSDLKSVQFMRKRNLRVEKKWRNKLAQQGLTALDVKQDEQRKGSTIKFPKMPWKIMGNILNSKNGDSDKAKH